MKVKMLDTMSSNGTVIVKFLGSIAFEVDPTRVSCCYNDSDQSRFHHSLETRSRKSNLPLLHFFRENVDHRYRTDNCVSTRVYRRQACEVFV